MNEQTARQIKVGKLVHALDSVTPGLSPDYVLLAMRNLTEYGWRTAEQLARVRPASSQTRQAVVEHFETRIRRERRVTTDKAARMLGLDASMVRRYCRSGRLIAVKEGRDWWISPAEIKRFKRQPRPVGRPKP